MTPPDPGPPAVVLLSGGLDSSTVLALARQDGYTCHALSFRYGQRHAVELKAAARVAQALGAAQHLVMDMDLRLIGGSALTSDLPVPKDRPHQAMAQGVPVTYVPARNTLFLSLAVAWAETLDCTDIFIGVNALDYSGYPDCRPEFIAAFQEVANLGTRLGAEMGRRFGIHTPLINLSKAQIIAQGLRLGLDYAITHSCYDPGEHGLACGRCDSCQLRLKGFAQAGARDPLPYAV
ncbi:MAG: 7-cyano-7-deazaguanine synthase QueC [Desulfarculus sp.]|nr:7-cyano-7-deazaguanine synthase QueC [Desulfarculus sp.]